MNKNSRRLFWREFINTHKPSKDFIFHCLKCFTFIIANAVLMIGLAYIVVKQDPDLVVYLPESEVTFWNIINSTGTFLAGVGTILLILFGWLTIDTWKSENAHSRSMQYLDEWFREAYLYYEFAKQCRFAEVYEEHRKLLPSFEDIKIQLKKLSESAQFHSIDLKDTADFFKSKSPKDAISEIEQIKSQLTSYDLFLSSNKNSLDRLGKEIQRSIIHYESVEKNFRAESDALLTLEANIETSTEILIRRIGLEIKTDNLTNSFSIFKEVYGAKEDFCAKQKNKAECLQANINSFYNEAKTIIENKH